MEKYTEKELEAIEKAIKIMEKVGLYIEGTNEEMPDDDGLKRWCIYPKNEH